MGSARGAAQGRTGLRHVRLGGRAAWWRLDARAAQQPAGRGLTQRKGRTPPLARAACCGACAPCPLGSHNCAARTCRARRVTVLWGHAAGAAPAKAQQPGDPACGPMNPSGAATLGAAPKAAARPKADSAARRGPGPALCTLHTLQAHTVLRLPHPGCRPCLKLQSEKPTEMEPPLASFTSTCTC